MLQPLLLATLLQQPPAQTIRQQVQQAELTTAQQLAAQDRRSAANSLLGAGVILRKADKLQESGAKFQNAVKIDPTSSKAWYNLGLNQQQVGLHVLAANRLSPH
jgi:tetratricopeptide (TPR) repeat protein